MVVAFLVVVVLELGFLLTFLKLLVAVSVAVVTIVAVVVVVCGGITTYFSLPPPPFQDWFLKVNLVLFVGSSPGKNCR